MSTGEKELKTLEAVAALRGFTVHVTRDGSIVLSRAALGAWIYHSVASARAGLATLTQEAVV